MGLKTSIRFEGYIKKPFREVFKPIALNGEWIRSSNKRFKDFGQQYGRAFLIPTGVLSGAPDEWEEDNDFATTYNQDTGHWKFQCSIQNDQSEIEAFFKLIPYFVQSISHLEYYFETWNSSSAYSLVCGKVVETSNTFKEYQDF